MEATASRNAPDANCVFEVPALDSLLVRVAALLVGVAVVSEESDNGKDHAVFLRRDARGAARDEVAATPTLLKPAL